jgi:SHS2 domain-containing protein
MREWVDHTGELELHVRASTREAVFGEASEALGEVLGDAEGDLPRERVLRVEGRDLAALLAEWLAELVWLAECESLIVERLTAVRVSEDAVEATVLARRGRPRHLVKAVTYHGLSCERDEAGWRATVVLDV